jgi:hypothetical protein
LYTGSEQSIGFNLVDATGFGRDRSVGKRAVEIGTNPPAFTEIRFPAASVLQSAGRIRSLLDNPGIVFVLKDRKLSPS